MSQLFAAHAGPAAAGSAPAGLPEIEYPSPLSALPDEPLPFLVKNTFVVPAHLEPSSLLGSSAFAPRAARSCPGSGCAGGRGPGGRRGEEEEEEEPEARARPVRPQASQKRGRLIGLGSMPMTALSSLPLPPPLADFDPLPLSSPLSSAFRFETCFGIASTFASRSPRKPM